MANQKSGKGSNAIRSLIKHLILFGISFGMAGLVFLMIMDRLVMPFYQRSGSAIHAPDLRGLDLDRAAALIDSLNLDMLIEEEEFDNSFPAHSVSRQTPEPGTTIKPGRRIRIIESLGPRPLTVPDVIGKTPRDARLMIQSAGLEVRDEGEVWVPSNDYPYGIIARQEPPANAEVPENTGMMLYISNGRRETNVLMPNLVRLSLSAARDSLQAHNFNLFRLQIQYEENTSLLPDTVIEQYPDPGQPANTNQEVNLVVSTSGKDSE